MSWLETIPSVSPIFALERERQREKKKNVLHGGVLKRTPACLFLVCFFSCTFMRSLPVVKKALIVFHQCCMRSAASAAAAVAPIVSSFCLFSGKKDECLNHRGILKLKYRAASVAGVMTRGRAGVVRKRVRFLFCFGAKKKKQQHYGTE